VHAHERGSETERNRESERDGEKRVSKRERARERAESALLNNSVRASSLVTTVIAAADVCL